MAQAAVEPPDAETSHHLRRQRPSGIVTGSLFTFVVLGLPAGMLGVAWPVLRHEFGQPLASLGELLLASLLGYLAVTSVTGRALRRFGATAMLAASAALAAAGTGLFIAAHWWPLLVIVSALIGASGGGLDAALNTAVALTGRARLMNLIHAGFGVGAALGPLLVTAAVVTTGSWRAAYGVLLVLNACLAAAWVALRNEFSALPRRPAHVAQADQPPHAAHIAQADQPPHAAQADQPAYSGQPAHTGQPLARPPPRFRRNPRFAALLVLSLAVFFCYAGLEIAIGSWAASFLRGPGGLPGTLAGLAVFGYWAGLTVGRVGVTALGPRLPPRNAARAGTVGAIAGSAAVWANISPAATVTGLVVIGISLGPIFPALVNLTPGRVGQAAAVSVVGWELAASGVGGAGLSALAGVVLQLAGLATFGPVLTVLAVTTCGLNLLVERAASAARRHPPTS